MSKYIDAEKLISEIERLKDKYPSWQLKLAMDDLYNLIPSLQQEQPKKRLIQVKCLYPYDESWQKNKVYTCEVWHHGDLNRDFWDVYYDYGKDSRYVQFSSIELLSEEFVVIQEQPKGGCSEKPNDHTELSEEQPEFPSGEDVMTMCNQILIDWVKEGKTQEEKEQREQAHIRFFELYDDYLMHERPEVDLEEETKRWWKEHLHINPENKLWMDAHQSVVFARHFYELGFNVRKEK